MMEVVADNEHQREQPVDPVAPPPAVRPPTEVTPEQIRQFQEFQQFQELMRQQEQQGLPPGTPPGAAPPPKGSLAKRLIRSAVSKIVTGLVVLAVLVMAGWWAIDHFFGPDLNQKTASETGGEKAKGNLIYDTDPYEAVRKVYAHIANGRIANAKGAVGLVCPRFKDGGEKFAADMGYESCDEAVKGLASQVISRNDYAESMPSAKPGFVPANETEVRISSCADSKDGIKGGPPLGVFTVEKDPDSEEDAAGHKQWIITDHATEPTCTSGSTTPSN
jgi:hypothetical protein